MFNCCVMFNSNLPKLGAPSACAFDGLVIREAGKQQQRCRDAKDGANQNQAWKRFQYPTRRRRTPVFGFILKQQGHSSMLASRTHHTSSFCNLYHCMYSVWFSIIFLTTFSVSPHVMCSLFLHNNKPFSPTRITRWSWNLTISLVNIVAQSYENNMKIDA